MKMRQYADALQFAQRQVRHLIERHPDFLPMYTTGGRWHHAGEAWTDWCGGFLAGMMWLFHQRTGDAWWRTQAEHYSNLLEHRKLDRHVHDLGFIFLNTHRRWFEVSSDPSRMDIVAEAGVTLAGRFQPEGLYLASFIGPHSLFIDIMMNVPLLYVAAEWLEGQYRVEGSVASDELNAEIATISGMLRFTAIAHCLTSLEYLVRPDGSTAHEAVFDTATGEFLRESTQQGLRADSCWSRGQAWALYGFGTAFRHTGDEDYLQTACRCADYFLARLPASQVPYWDFDVPDGQNQPWDSSAAAIAASGLLQLAELTERTPDVATRYREAALRILDALCSDQFLASSTAGEEGILLHAVYHIHKGLGVDESVMWGDHFFVEALVKALTWMEKERG